MIHGDRWTAFRHDRAGARAWAARLCEAANSAFATVALCEDGGRGYAQTELLLMEARALRHVARACQPAGFERDLIEAATLNLHELADALDEAAEMLPSQRCAALPLIGAELAAVEQCLAPMRASR